MLDLVPFNAELSDSTSEAQVEAAIKETKDIVFHSMSKSQANNWIFITQVEAYYHQKSLDDVAQVNNKGTYPRLLEFNMKKREEGKKIDKSIQDIQV